MRRYYPTMSVRDRIATPEGKRRFVRTLFATIADRYDFITIALSYGRDRRWKKRLIDLSEAAPGMRALDLATGTGDLAFAASARGARVVGLDVTRRMIELARAKASRLHSNPANPENRANHESRIPNPIWFLVADMTALPFAS